MMLPCLLRSGALGKTDSNLRSSDLPPSSKAGPRGGREEVGGEVGQGGPEGRLAAADAAGRVPSSASPLGSVEDLLMAEPVTGA